MTGLKCLRKILGYSLQDLANILGVSNQIISMWEKGLKPIPQKRLEQLNNCFNIPQEYFTSIINKKEYDQLNVKMQTYIKEYMLQFLKDNIK